MNAKEMLKSGGANDLFAMKFIIYLLFLFVRC